MERTISEEFIKAVRRKVEQFEYEVKEVNDEERILEIYKDGVFVCTLNNDGMGLVFDDSIPVFAKEFWNECEQLQKIYEMYDKGERLNFEGIGHYKVISSFEDTILAGAIDSNNEMVFVTWKYDEDRKGVSYGNYFLHDYNRAKQDFSNRAGLSKQALTVDNGFVETIYKAAKYQMENDTNIDFNAEVPLNEVVEMLEDTYDFLKEEQEEEMNELKPYQIEAIKEHYPKGTRITLDQMDEKGMPSGLEGTVEFVDDIGQIHMTWDNGRTLALAPQVDKYHKSPVQEMEETEENINRYSDRINNTVLCNIDYDKLQDSYGTPDKAYAKEVLNELTQIAVEEYGTDYFDGFDNNEYVLVPGVLRSKSTNEMCVALLELDLTSSGEHFNTYFLTKHGCVDQGDTEMPNNVRNFIRETYGSYEYAYPIGIETDHHVDFDNLHKDLQEFLDTFENYTDYISGDRENNIQDPVKAIVSEPDGSYKAYVFENDPEQLATFIMNNSYCDKTEIYNSQGELMVSTMGHFLNKCSDMSIRDDLMKYLLPMQMGEVEVPPSVVKDENFNEVTLNLFGDEQDNDIER